jgi:hypothetical protein
MIGSRMNSPPGCRYSILLSCMQLLCPFLSLPTLSRLLSILSDGFDPFKTHLYGKSEDIKCRDFPPNLWTMTKIVLQ